MRAATSKKPATTRPVASGVTLTAEADPISSWRNLRPIAGAVMSNRAATGRVSPACVGVGSTLSSAGGGTKKTSCGDRVASV